MTTFRLTESQNKALATDKNIAVTAGAGSGKTRILVERFLKIVLKQPQLTRRVAAITFTEKAAGEMQERIAGEVNKRLKGQSISLTEKNNLQIIRDNLNSAYISTIHGFCMRILREFPVQADVPPDFVVLNPFSQNIKMYEAIGNLFSALDTNNQKEKWIRLFLAVPRQRIYKMLETALSKPYEMQQIKNNFRKHTKDTYIKFLTEKWLELLRISVSQKDVDLCYQTTDEILSLQSRRPQKDKGVKVFEILENFQRTYQIKKESIETLDHFCKVVEKMTTNEGKAYGNLSQLGSKESWQAIPAKKLLQLSKQLEQVAKGLLRFNPGSPPDEMDRQWFDIFSIFLDLYEQAYAEFQKLKEEDGALDFEDLQMATFRLLENKESVRQVLHERFRYLMVDEFQDTNPLQWSIVRLIAREKGRLASDKVFIVGDPKQSIYGFRDADIRVFEQVKQKFTTEAGVLLGYEGLIDFKESYRFLPNINTFINHVFQGILKKDVYNAYEVGFEELKAERNVPQDSGYIEVGLFDENEQDYSEAEYIAVTIHRLIRQNEIYERTESQDHEQLRHLNYGDIAILIRDRYHLFDIEQSLREYDIPFKTVGGIGFWQRQEIHDFYHILKFLTNPADDIALVALLRSRLFMLPDSTIFRLSEIYCDTYFERLQKLSSSANKENAAPLHNACSELESWLLLRERIGLGDLLRRIIERTHLLTILNAEFSGDQRVANIQKILELADVMEQSGSGGLHSFLSVIQDLVNRDVREGEALLELDDKSSVKIMTIHTSKGLQFPVVFVPYLNRAMHASGADIMLDAELGMAVSFRDEDNRFERKSENTLYNLLRLRQKQKDLAELKRIFYVGVSRASDYLFLSAEIKDKAKSDSMYALLENELAGSIPAADQNDKVIIGKSTVNIVHKYQALEKDTGDKPAFKQMLSVLEKADFNSESSLKLVQPIRTETEARIFSATALMTYLKNPDEYFNRYHLGFFEADYNKIFPSSEDENGEIDSLLFGKIVHRYFEMLNKAVEKQTLVENILFEFEVFDPFVRKKILKDLQRIEKIIHNSETGQEILNSKEYRNELELTMRLGNDYFTGTIDRLQKNRSGLWEIIDYKTNRIKPDQLDQAGAEYKVQMQSYGLLLNRLYPQQTEFPVSLYFINIDELYKQVFTRNILTQIEQEFISTIEKIKTQFPVTSQH